MSEDEATPDVTTKTAPAVAHAAAHAAAIMMRVYYSSYHLWAARHFAELAASLENTTSNVPRFDIRHRSYVTNAILSAVAFLEAAINELFKDVADNHEAYIAPIDAEARNLIITFWELTEGRSEGRNHSPFSILDKYNIILTFCRKPRLEPGLPPYQNAGLVIKLRNELTHYKPNSYGGDVQHRLTQQLAGKFAQNPLMAGSENPYFPDKCLGSPCANWCVCSVVRFADVFFTEIGVSPNYHQAQF